MMRILTTLWRLFLGEVSVELVGEEKGKDEYEARNDYAEDEVIHRRHAPIDESPP